MQKEIKINKLSYIFTAVVILFCYSNIGAQEHSDRNPIVVFYPSHLSPNDSILALDLWTKKHKRLEKDIGFLDLKTGSLMPQTIKSILPEAKYRYIERESFSWHPNNRWVYFTLHKTDESYKLSPTSNNIFKYDIYNATIDTIKIGSKEKQLIYPIISNNNKHIIVVGYDVLKNNPTGTLYVFHNDKQKTEILEVNIDIIRPIISPDSKKVAYIKNGDLHIISLTTNQKNELTNFKKEIQITSIYWIQNDIYFISVKPSFTDLAEQMKDWTSNGKKGEEPTYIKELWRISSNKDIAIEKIVSFKTMRVGMSLYDDSTLLVSLPDKDNKGAYIWKYDLKTKNLIQLSFDGYDDLPMGSKKNNKIFFRRNARDLYSMDLYGKEKPNKIYGPFLKR